MFVAAKIHETLPGVFKLHVEYSWYGLHNFQPTVDVYVYKSLQEAIAKLAIIRCGSGLLEITNHRGEPINIDPNQVI